MKGRPLRNDVERRRASEIVAFEVFMFCSALESMLEARQENHRNPTKRSKSNFMLHALLIAARNITSFLYAYKPRPTDNIAEDFLEEPRTWKENRPSVAPELMNGTFVTLISRRLAHLTWERARSNKHSWKYPHIAAELSTGLRVFVSIVESGRLDDSFVKSVERLGQLVTIMRSIFVSASPDVLSLTTELPFGNQKPSYASLADGG